MSEPDHTGHPRRGSDRWPLRRWITLTISALVAICVGAIAVGTLAIADLSEVRESLVDRIDPAVQEALRLDTALVDQETGVRGFALTGSPDVLEPYVTGRIEQDLAQRKLRGLVGWHEEITDRLDRVQREANLWRDEYAEPLIATLRESDIEPPTEQLEDGKERFDQVRIELRGLQTVLETVRTQQRGELGASSARLIVVCVAIAVMLLLVFVLLTLVLRGAVAGPLSRLAWQVRLVADGDFKQTFDVSGPREIVELTGDVDSMRRRILDELAIQRAINAELDVRTEDLKRSNSELEQFAYVASHDLQEPLRKVASFCQLLERRYAGQLDERADQYIGFAVDGAKRMQILINDLLTFSRVGRHVRDHVTLDAAELVQQARANLADVIEETGAQIDVGPMPRVRGEFALLVAVFQNLVGNALKFQGADPPHVRIEAERQDDELQFSVADNGIGIEPEHAERIFVIFQRLHPKEAYSGTGIGLAMCRKIIEYHGGRIWLDQTPREGTMFRFTLPAPDILEEPDSQAEPDEAENSTSEKAEDAS